jgi:large subunit ribosomal protein L17
MNEKITTTLPKAKELRRFIERLITIAKAGKPVSYRRIRRDIDDGRVVRKLYDVITQRYNNRPGGYTRIFNLGYRKGDSAPIATIKLIQ